MEKPIEKPPPQLWDLTEIFQKQVTIDENYISYDEKVHNGKLVTVWRGRLGYPLWGLCNLRKKEAETVAKYELDFIEMSNDNEPCHNTLTFVTRIELCGLEQ